MSYKKLDISEGRIYFPHVWNMVFRPQNDENFFVQPWSNRELRDCAEFRIGTGRNGSDEVWFFTTDVDIIDFLTNTPGDIYLFGAYNQINVCQMRAGGAAKPEIEYSETDQLRARLCEAIKQRVGANVSKLSEAEAEARYAIINSGTLFSFHISSYAYDMYERG